MLYRMRIEQDIKLDYKDVLLRPKRSVLGSRKQVILKREFHFRHTDYTWCGHPIVAANMDHVGTMEMSHALKRHTMLTCLHKHHTVEQYQNNWQEIKDYAAVSMGITEREYNKIKPVLRHLDVKFICIDVANGYSERFSKFVRVEHRHIKNASEKSSKNRSIVKPWTPFGLSLKGNRNLSAYFLPRGSTLEAKASQ